MPARLISDPTVRFVKNQPGWRHTDTGMDGGRFGRIVHVAVCDPDGNFLFDRPVVEEGPHVITLTYGRDPTDGEIKMALVRERRDTAAELDGADAPEFWGPPRGFAEPGEQGAIAAGRREAGEEAGARVLVGDPWLVGEDFITNETCTRSRSPIVAIAVDLSQLYDIQDDQDRGEKIFQASFFSLDELDDLVRVGHYEGASTRSMVLISAVTLFRLYVLPVATSQQQWSVTV